MQKKCNIFIEGIPGSGKTTLLEMLEKNLPEYSFYYEGDLSPVELAWCAYMTREQYARVMADWPQWRNAIAERTMREDERYIVAYPKIRTDQAEFYHRMEQYEIYCGRKSPAEFREIIFRRFSKYSQTGSVFECSFFQNIIEELMLFAQYDEGEIFAFYRELISLIDIKNFRMIRLKSGNIKESIEHVKKERVNEQGEEEWYRRMVAYLADSPYGKNHGCETLEDVLSHFRRRIALEDKIVSELLPKKCIELESKHFDWNDVLSYIKEEIETT